MGKYLISDFPPAWLYHHLQIYVFKMQIILEMKQNWRSHRHMLLLKSDYITQVTLEIKQIILGKDTIKWI